ncbi:4-hydroxy-3-methylbut-2-enyl diphosphate reductase [Polynucleobacter sp. 15G-AUS-farblos]|uniref:4-hydroxy-3-methylbut-2-enyl diphosphate reductase n=1 Tax=Polynucleobacter sp. 15G-AUS-farblos TaxID=2689094 RepID=UPI001C0DCE6E|nr:4-hydroxy-3-methylbut-2-enyl diphosphate reductase [Polynucleobacter sp. 15G-AUS-farblos]MBU3583394.1 4-hydroxy-3-methylbut-2-enyl diphosphate reductase [Polynucleobacter sp. 15G-AUS-farblos]
MTNPSIPDSAEILMAQPRGFCAGVDRAINIVNEALNRFGAPIYVRHEIVHNAYVVNELRDKGAVFVEGLHEVPKGGIVVFSAHGVSQEVRKDAQERGLQVYDATCPLVTKVHLEVVKMCKDGFTVLMIGHAGHPEVEGTMGQVKEGVYLIEKVEDIESLPFSVDEKIAFVTQTTLSVDETKEIVDALTKKFPNIVQPRKQDICYATQNRQDAVKFMAPQVDVVIVVGSAASSNSNRLRELSEKLGVPSYMVDAPDQLKAEWFLGKKRVGLTAGASAPESLAQSIVKRIQEFGLRQVRALPGVVEDVTFSLPKNLID